MTFKDKTWEKWYTELPKGTPVMACLPIPDDWTDMNWEEMPAYTQLIGYVAGIPRDKGHGYIEVSVRYYPSNDQVATTWSWPCLCLQPL